MRLLKQEQLALAVALQRDEAVVVEVAGEERVPITVGSLSHSKTA